MSTRKYTTTMTNDHIKDFVKTMDEEEKRILGINNENNLLQLADDIIKSINKTELIGGRITFVAYESCDEKLYIDAKFEYSTHRDGDTCGAAITVEREETE